MIRGRGGNRFSFVDLKNKNISFSTVIFKFDSLSKAVNQSGMKDERYIRGKGNNSANHDRKLLVFCTQTDTWMDTRTDG